MVLFYVGLAKQSIKKGSFLSPAEYFYTEVILAVMELSTECCLDAVWRFWAVTGGAYPYWFLGQNKFRELNLGSYTSVPNSYLAQRPQTIYIIENYAGCAQFWVHTPQYDPPGLYAVFESRSYGAEHAWACSAGDTMYLFHRRWPGEIDVTLLMNTVVQPIKSRL